MSSLNAMEPCENESDGRKSERAPFFANMFARIEEAKKLITDINQIVDCSPADREARASKYIENGELLGLLIKLRDSSVVESLTQVTKPTPSYTEELTFCVALVRFAKDNKTALNTQETTLVQNNYGYDLSESKAIIFIEISRRLFGLDQALKRFDKR